MHSINQIFGYISRTKIAGVVPLDIVAHFILGILILLFCLKILKLDFKKSFLILLALTVGKEIYDSFTLTATWEEALKDFCVTFSYPILRLGITKLMKKIEDA
ncbi:MAG: hypothetical protein HN509_00560 [Halobacteriovoraceae bacterium]|jgi:hypothetical protein|nr:hypothetical protein [Halobacteriovoraceae bacterium]